MQGWLNIKLSIIFNATCHSAEENLFDYLKENENLLTKFNTFRKKKKQHLNMLRTEGNFLNLIGVSTNALFTFKAFPVGFRTKQGAYYYYFTSTL